MNIKEQFAVLISRLQELKEVDLSKDCIDYVKEIITSCGEYVERVTRMEASIQSARIIMEPEDYRTYISNLDKARKIAHDGVIANMAILNRYCRLVDLPPIYKGDLNDRYAVAEFAMEIVGNYFENRQL